MTITVTLNGLLPPSAPTQPLPVTWYQNASGDIVLHVARTGGGYSWRASSLRDLTSDEALMVPGGMWITGMAEAVAALDRCEVPEWKETA